MLRGYKYRSGNGILDYNGQSIFERDIETLVNNQIYFPTIKELNDPAEGFINDKPIFDFIEKYTDKAEEVNKAYKKFYSKINNVGIYSLSKSITNELLWAYYASGHTGFAIEYDIDVIKQSNNYNQYIPELFDFDVDYISKIPEVDVFTLKNDKAIDVIKLYLGSKSKSWRHEKEYRLIFEHKGIININPKAIKGIYFGCRMTDKEIDFIMSRLKGRKLSYYKMTFIDKSYQMKATPIADRYDDCPYSSSLKINFNIDDILFPENITAEEAYKYKDIFKEIIDDIANEPYIDKIYSASIKKEEDGPLFIVWAYTQRKEAPCREFNYKLNNDGKIECIK